MLVSLRIAYACVLLAVGRKSEQHDAFGRRNRFDWYNRDRGGSAWHYSGKQFRILYAHRGTCVGGGFRQLGETSRYGGARALSIDDYRSFVRLTERNKCTYYDILNWNMVLYHVSCSIDW